MNKNKAEHPLVTTLQRVYTENALPEKAFWMKKYMLNQFEFHGLMTPVRKNLSKPILIGYNPGREELIRVTGELWDKPQREYQYTAMTLVGKHIKKLQEQDHNFLEELITWKSWWDTVDFIAAHLIGSHLRKYPRLIPSLNRKWLASDNMWLQRTTLLFQLRYKENTDTRLLFSNNLALASSKEFFIRKAIGWSLREYSKTNPNAVEHFVNQYKLSGLSKREALKVIRRKEHRRLQPEDGRPVF